MIQGGLSKHLQYDISGAYTDISALVKILTQTDAPSTDSPMNYSHYEAKIVESFGVALEGWPLPGHVSNPGNLNSNDMNTLWKALNRGMCKWVALTPEELSACKIDNQHCAANGEEVYGPPRKQRTRNVAPRGVDDNGSDDNE